MAKKKKPTQNQCIKNMRSRYGTESDYVNAEVYMTGPEVEEAFGPMCERYEPLCSCCRAWVQWNTTGKVTVTLCRDEVLEILGVAKKI
jgi:hypothetical protein